MQQIADWLEKLGMSEYAQRFAENRIDFSVLPDLTDQHLKDLQLPLGDRLKMLRAIRELSGAIPPSPETPRLSQKAEASPPMPRQYRSVHGPPTSLASAVTSR